MFLSDIYMIFLFFPRNSVQQNVSRCSLHVSYLWLKCARSRTQRSTW